MYHNHRTVAGVQRKVTKESQRNRVSRFLHAKSDEEEIGNRKPELDRVLHVFQLRPLAILTAGLQAGPAINIHVVSDIRDGAANANNIVLDTQNAVSSTHIVVSNTQNIVSDTHDIVSD